VAHQEPAERRENTLLREARIRRGWTLQDTAEVLYQCAAEFELPESKADGSLVGKWERGVKQPSNGYVLLLCLAYEQEPRELALPARPGVLREFQRLISMRHMNRRDAMRLGLGAGVAVGLSAAAWDRLVTALTNHLQPDHHVLDGLRAITTSYRDLTHTTAPGALLPAVQEQFVRLQQLLGEPRLAGGRDRGTSGPPLLFAR
jgi:transcriptional regulator with XRE-family HTH domain